MSEPISDAEARAGDEATRLWDGDVYRAPDRPGDRMVVDPAQMPQDWLDAFAEQGVPNWAALQAWNEAADDDTVMQIKARARQIAQTDE